ncbi:plasmid mobilization relaxosome protein MobC, partial [Kineococcus esterisolvens]|uniref:plasmid mobilization relaxosome protein MobC n=2 Tax=unclassified Kineococcus TaxID=2621656 RepID=UPI003D7D7DE8
CSAWRAAPRTTGRKKEASMAVERTRTVAVRLTPEEHAAWEAAAASAGRGRLGAWVRDEVNARLEQGVDAGAVRARGGRAVRTSKETSAGAPGGAPGGVGLGVDMELAEVLARSSVLRGELSRVANNLNQAVHAVHVHGVQSGVLAQLRAAVVEVRAVMTLVQQRVAAAGASASAARGGAGTSRGAAVAAAAKAKRAPRRVAPATPSAPFGTPLSAPSSAPSHAPSGTPGPGDRPVQRPGQQPVNPWLREGERDAGRSGGRDAGRGGAGGGAR